MSVQSKDFRVVVTGAAGFVGKHLVNHLRMRGYRLFAIEHKDANITPIRSCVEDILLIDQPSNSVRISNFFSSIKPGAIIHLAAIVRPEKETKSVSTILRTNVELGTHILNACVNSGIKIFINTGSFWEEMNHTGEYKPANLYAASKRAFQNILEYYSDAHSITAITFRLFGNYGRGDNRKNLFASLRESYRSARPVPFSSGRQKLDLVSIQDVVLAYELALTKTQNDLAPRHKVVEIGTGEMLSLREIADAYSIGCENSLNIAWGALKDRIREPIARVACLESARDFLGWKPNISMRDGIAELARLTHSYPYDQKE